MVRMKITMRVGRRMVSSWGYPQGVHLCQREDREVGGTVEGTGGGREVTRVVTHLAAGTDGG